MGQIYDDQAYDYHLVKNASEIAATISTEFLTNLELMIYSLQLEGSVSDSTKNFLKCS